MTLSFNFERNLKMSSECIGENLCRNTVKRRCEIVSRYGWWQNRSLKAKIYHRRRNGREVDIVFEPPVLAIKKETRLSSILFLYLQYVFIVLRDWQDGL